MVSIKPPIKFFLRAELQKIGTNNNGKRCSTQITLPHLKRQLENA